MGTTGRDHRGRPAIGPGMQRRERDRQIGDDVVPALGKHVLFEQKLRSLHVQNLRLSACQLSAYRIQRPPGAAVGLRSLNLWCPDALPGNRLSSDKRRGESSAWRGLSLVLVEEVLDGAAVLPHPLDDLLGLPTGTLGSFLPWMTMSGALMFPALCMGLMDSRKARSFSSEPYSGSRKPRR